MDRNVNIITDLDGKKIVLINDIRFKAKKREDWKDVEEYLKEYVEEFYEIAETSEKIFIWFVGNKKRNEQPAWVIRLYGENPFPTTEYKGYGCVCQAKKSKRWAVPRAWNRAGDIGIPSSGDINRK